MGVSILPGRLRLESSGASGAGGQALVGELSHLLERWKQGDLAAGEEVVAQTYAELRRVAHGFVRRERAGQSVQTTGLLHEAYVRLLRRGPGTADTKDAFFRLMAAEMRRRLIDHARRRLAEKRGGRVVHEPLRSSVVSMPTAEDVEPMLERLDRALGELDRTFPRA